MPYLPNYAEIAVEFDWSHLGEKPGGMTAMFFPVDGKKPIEYKTGSNYSIVRLPKGVYNIVAFNYSTVEFDAIRFRGTDNYDTFEAYAAQLPDVTLGKVTKVDNIVDHPDILAVDKREEFEVSEEMVKRTQEIKSNANTKDSKSSVVAHLIFKPVKLVAPGTVKVHLGGLNFVRSAKGVIRGLASSVFLASHKTANPASLMFSFTEPTYYQGSKLNGHVSGHFTTFGMLPEEFKPETAKHGEPKTKTSKSENKYSFLFSSILVDKEQTIFEALFDVTGKIEQRYDVNLNILLNLNLELGVSENPTDETPTIIVPEVKPAGSGGFEVDVEGWGDEDNVDLDIK